MVLLNYGGFGAMRLMVCLKYATNIDFVERNMKQVFQLYSVDFFMLPTHVIIPHDKLDRNGYKN